MCQPFFVDGDISQLVQIDATISDHNRVGDNFVFRQPQLSRIPYQVHQSFSGVIPVSTGSLLKRKMHRPWLKISRV
jgi:hypothetical protein